MGRPFCEHRNNGWVGNLESTKGTFGLPERPVMVLQNLSETNHSENDVQSTLSKADTLGTRFTVRLREVSALERVHLT